MIAAWQPEGFFLSPENLLKVSASDVDNDQLCPQHGYVKARPGTSIRGTHGWKKTYDPEDFTLKRFLAALSRYHHRRAQGDPHYLSTTKAKDIYRECHPGLRQYLDQALENYLDFVDSRQIDVGEPLDYLGYDHGVRITQRGMLAAWAPIYCTPSGKVEIYRIKEHRISAQVNNWDILAGHLGASLPGVNVRSVTVAEVSLYRGHGRIGESIKIQDATPQRLASLYEMQIRPRALEIVAGSHPRPGRDCASCRVTAVCSGLTPMDGVLQQHEKGPYTRSVSATDLSVYERCPARWYLERKLRLPVSDDTFSNPALNRGRIIHDWLKEAHGRGISCTYPDVPEVADRLPTDVGASINNESYAAILPFLRGHIAICPLSAVTKLLNVDKVLYGWDQSADTIIASAPDIVYIREDRLVIRETKTTDSALPATANEARDMFNGIVYWLLTLTSQGWLAAHNLVLGIVELEILTPIGANVFQYGTDDISVMVVAETRVKHMVEKWHEDTTWTSKPGAQCRTCPVAQWCPDADKYDQLSPQTLASPHGQPF